MPMATKRSRVVTFNKELPSIKSEDPLIAWSYKVTRQIRYVISLLPQDLWPLNLAMWRVNVRGLYMQPFKHVLFKDRLTNRKCFVPSTTLPEATKVNNVVT